MLFRSLAVVANSLAISLALLLVLAANPAFAKKSLSDLSGKFQFKLNEAGSGASKPRPRPAGR